MGYMRFAQIGLFSLVMALYGAQVVKGQEVINRREQARRMLLTAPPDIYSHYCAHCHGDDATGSGRLWASELAPKPADLRALGASENEDYLIDAIRDGSSVHGKSNLCPPWRGTIPPSDVKRLARYIVSLGGETTPLSDTSEPQASARGLPAPVKEPFPWQLGTVLLAEIIFVGWLLRARREASNVVPQDSPVRG